MPVIIKTFQEQMILFSPPKERGLTKIAKTMTMIFWSIFALFLIIS
jgi:hypothetical protein